MFNRVCKRIINIAYCVIFSFILFTVLFISSRLEYWYKAQGIVNNVVSLIVGFTLILFLWSLIKIFSDKIDNALKAIKVIGIAVFVLQIIFANEIYFITDWDAGTVNYISSALLYKIPLDEWQTYYIKMYPNNLIIAIIEYIIKYVASIFNFDEYFSLIVVGIMSANIAMYYTAKTVYILTSSKTVTYLSYSLSLILFGFSPWIVIPYSDAYSILLPIASIYCYLMHKKKYGEIGISWYLVGCILMSVLGYLIKPQVIIVLIAILIFEIIVCVKVHKKQYLKKCITYVGILVIAFSLMVLVKNISFKVVKIDPDKNLSYGITHFLMMGLNEESSGGFSNDDYLFTGNLPTYEEKVINISLLRVAQAEFGLLQSLH